MVVNGGLNNKGKEKGGKFGPGGGKNPLDRIPVGYEEKVAEKRELIILLRPRII